ncbi:MAG: hypothetical protein JWO31_1653 [Phycisphaerales bacterium]|nr:hypothetical protein [Phycisphaerales bacterium]
MQGEYLYGSIRGSLQTPAGGQPGTTSLRRPTLDEIGIDRGSVADAAVVAESGPHALYLGGQWVGASGTATLRDPLVSHAKAFPAGTTVRSDLSLDWYRLGYAYTYVAATTAGGAPVLTFRPAAGAALFTFDYRVRDDADPGRVATRSYGRVLPQVGLEAEWRPGGGPFALSAGALGFPAIGTVTPGISTEHLVAGYRWSPSRSLTLDGFVGVAFEQFAYEDNQPVPNRIRADLGPALVVGLTARF